MGLRLLITLGITQKYLPGTILVITSLQYYRNIHTTMKGLSIYTYTSFILRLHLMVSM